MVVESRHRDSKYEEHMGAVTLCGTLTDVLLFVSDPDQLADWVPQTLSAERLRDKPDGVVYHVVTDAPWPYRNRDMVYDLTVSLHGTTATVTMKGLPEEAPPPGNLFRMRDVDGEWWFESRDGQVDVRLRLWVDPGGGPAFIVNRRAAATVGGMLANLRDRFVCDNGSPRAQASGGD